MGIPDLGLLCPVVSKADMRTVGRWDHLFNSELQTLSVVRVGSHAVHAGTTPGLPSSQAGQGDAQGGDQHKNVNTMPRPALRGGTSVLMGTGMGGGTKGDPVPKLSW